MPRRGRPGFRQIVKAVPVKTSGLACEQLHRALKSPFLDLFSPERGDTDFRYPHGKITDRLNFAQFLRPFVDHPMVPVEWKSMNRDNIHRIEHALTLHICDEVGIDW